jgi:hypothetical protein
MDTGPLGSTLHLPAALQKSPGFTGLPATAAPQQSEAIRTIPRLELTPLLTPDAHLQGRGYCLVGREKRAGGLLCFRVGQSTRGPGSSVGENGSEDRQGNHHPEERQENHEQVVGDTPEAA